MSDKKLKVAIVCICLNPPYWPFANDMIRGLNRFFLKKYDIREKYETQVILWSDIPEHPDDIKRRVGEYLLSRGEAKASVVNAKEIEILLEKKQEEDINSVVRSALEVRNNVKIVHTDPVEWPMPTLLRYNLFLQEEEYLKGFDYIFYIDVDMAIVDWIGEEILGDGLTAAEHPMYSLRKNLYPPYEPNENSTAFIKRPGKAIVDEDGKQRFKSYYYAGGFQGGRASDFIKAMKVMKKNIEDDFNNNYVAIWNDESHWNKYLFDNPPAVVLSPAYIYPDSLLQEYYFKIWGRNYSPKIMTLTKSFSTSKEAGAVIQEQLATL